MKILKNKSYQALLLRAKSAEIAVENAQKTIKSLNKSHENLKEERDRLMKQYVEVVKERDALLPQTNADAIAPEVANKPDPKKKTTKKK